MGISITILIDLFLVSCIIWANMRMFFCPAAYVDSCFFCLCHSP